MDNDGGRAMGGGEGGGASWEPMPSVTRGGVGTTTRGVRVRRDRTPARRGSNATARRGSNGSAPISGHDGPRMVRDDASDPPRRRSSFRPYPATEAGRSSFESHHRLSLPKPASSIGFDRYVCLDGCDRVDVAMGKHNGADARRPGTSSGEGRSDAVVSSGDHSSDDASSYKTQTVVWDQDDECVPMSAWQLNIHVRVPSLMPPVSGYCGGSRCVLNFQSHAVSHPFPTPPRAADVQFSARGGYHVAPRRRGIHVS